MMEPTMDPRIRALRQKALDKERAEAKARAERAAYLRTPEGKEELRRQYLEDRRILREIGEFIVHNKL